MRQRLPLVLAASLATGCVLSCARDSTPATATWQTEIAGMPGVWKVVPKQRRPQMVLEELARTRDPNASSWHQAPHGTEDEALVFSYALRGGAAIHGVLAAQWTGDMKVVVRLIGRGEDQFWPLWVWRADANADPRSRFTAWVPEGGEWIGGVVTVSGAGDGQMTLEVESLIIEEARVPSQRPNLLLLTLDTFRADHMSCLNPHAPATPTLDSLAAAGTTFEQAVSTTQCTTPSHTSMLTGLYCFAHHVYQNHEGLAPEGTTIAEVLNAEGYRTLGAVSIAHLNPETSNLGQGFDTFISSLWPHLGGEPADVRSAHVLRTLQQLTPDDRPWFMWIHYFDPHTPYTPPDEFRDRYPGTPVAGSVRYLRGMGAVAHDSATGLVMDPDGEVTRYRGEVSFLDRGIGALCAGLRRMGILEHAAVIVVADHGEGLGEHGIYFEHAGMFESVLHVPLIVSGAGIPSGRRVATRVTGLDVFPTILSLAGVKHIPPQYGHDLLPLCQGRKGPTHEVILAEAVNRAICAAWRGNQKLVWIPESKPQDWSVPERRMLFDLGSDPDETTNTLADDDKTAAELQAFFDQQAAQPLVRLETYRGAADKDRLRALGYVE